MKKIGPSYDKSPMRKIDSLYNIRWMIDSSSNEWSQDNHNNWRNLPTKHSPMPSTWWAVSLCPLSCSSPECTDCDSCRSQRSWWWGGDPPDSCESRGHGARHWVSRGTSCLRRSDWQRRWGLHSCRMDEDRCVTMVVLCLNLAHIMHTVMFAALKFAILHEQ